MGFTDNAWGFAHKRSGNDFKFRSNNAVQFVSLYMMYLQNHWMITADFSLQAQCSTTKMADRRTDRSVLVDFERNLYVIAAVMPVDFERRFEIAMLTSW